MVATNVLVTEVEKPETTELALAENPVESEKETKPIEAVKSHKNAEVKPPLVSVKETEKSENTAVISPESSVDRTLEETQPAVTVESQESAEVKPSLPVKESDLETVPLTADNKSEELQEKEIVSETLVGSDRPISQDSLPTLPTVDEAIEGELLLENLPPSVDNLPAFSEVNNSITAYLIARLESMKQSLNDSRSADDPSQGSNSQDWIDRLNKLTEKLLANESAAVSDKTVALVEKLEETIDRLIQPPIQPTLPSIETAQFDFPLENQPIIGVIDTGFAGNNPDIDYSRITWGQDRVDGDADPRIEPGKGNEHGTHVLGIIAATQNNGVGINGINEKAPIWAGRAIGSGKWAESLVEFVNAAVESNQPNAVVNLSLDLTQINPDGSVTTRYELTPEERSAIEYARQNNVLLAVPAGNDGSVMSALGQASQKFDNIITVGAAERINDEIAISKAFDRASYSSYGYGLDVLAPGGTIDNPELSTVGDGVGMMAGTSVASAKVTGAISQVWAANPKLNYRQVIQIIKDTATDLKSPDWDEESGIGLLNVAAAVDLAIATEPINFPKDDVIGPGDRLPVDPLTGVEYKPGEILVKFKPGVTETEISMLAQTQGAIALENLFVGSPTDSTNGQWKVLKFEPNADLELIRAALALDSNVAGLELNYKLSINATRDPMVNSLWGLNNTGQTGGSADADIDAPEAWGIQTGSKDVTVAVIDTGGDYRHQDLAANTWRNTGEIAGNGVDDDNNGFVDDVHGYDFVNTDGDPMDDEGHGTHVAGTIGAVGNNNIGVVGVNHNVSLMHLKFLDSGGFGFTDNAARAIDYATRMGAKVINASFGGGGYSQSMFDAISRANNAGVLFVAAAGNDANNNDLNPDFPTNYDLPNIISVAATDERDRLAWFSNYGRDTVDLAAPGVNILSTLPGNSYGQFDGTSMAAPHVAGAAALLLAQKPNQSPAQLKNILMESADRVTSLEATTVTGGRLNVHQALSQIAPPPRPIWEIAIENEHQQTKGLLGNPKNDTYFDPTPSPAGTTGKGKDYEFGSIHWSEKYGAVALWGDLQREYEEYDSPNGSGGWLGFPTRREYDWNGGRRTDFEGGYIYWDGVRAKAYRLNELPPRVSDPNWQTAIENEYQQTKGLLGNPRNDTYFDPTPSPAGTTGKGKDYEFGSIHWSEKYGAVALWRDLQREYEEYSSPNGSGGWLGFPTRREYDWRGGRRTDFEGGYIYWDGQWAKAYRLNELPSNSTLSNPTTLSLQMGRVSSRVGNFPLNLRRQPNTSQASIGTLPVGTQLKILRTVDGGIYNPGTGNRKDWYEVEVNGRRGFVAAYYVTQGSPSQTDPGSGGTNQNMEAFFGWAKGKVGITRLDGLYNLRGQCVTLIARYVQEVFLPANQRTVSRAFWSWQRHCS
ncbi:MAG: S8 family serine peptidase [Oscillatoriales cyanobacterium RU_3_3]|nr:S8 family serine peptidase [Oscillatoriales cyanobacterium RU_3_3]